MKFDRFLRQLKSSARPLLAVLIDPDKYSDQVIAEADRLGADCFLVGGSVLESGDTDATVRRIKKLTGRPVILFPGDEGQLSGKADGLFLLSLLSGRNPEYLIGKHVKAAPLIRKLKLDTFPVAYILVKGGKHSATQKISGTRPLSDDNEIVNTAIAAEHLGFGAVYLEAGSGAATSVNPALVRRVKNSTGIPLIVGGGIRDSKAARSVINAGADMVVVGNALEKNVYLLEDLVPLFE